MSNVRRFMECAAFLAVLLILELYAAVTGDHDMP
ncbi:hypothetical protein Tam1G_1772 [Bifidobacterium imperatoris]|uniref:Uncharacterized protein n=1 Tax=Bifidobacterium imperatoris TaxID=2020965 RepID=A0A2N5IQG1_9BIFI|nr:hypothetical protein Tam1G_1772 [Bifidobacterium imperatoris]